MSAVDPDAYPSTDDEIPAFLDGLGLDGITDIHVHGLPEPLQRAVWRYFDGLTDPPWPITYRLGEAERLAGLRSMGITRHTALAYPHRPDVAAWCNDHTLGLARDHDQVIPTFTFMAEPSAESYVSQALDAGGLVAKVHLQVGRFDPTDATLRGVWSELERRRLPIVLHAGAVYGVDGGEAWCGPEPVLRLLDAHPDLRLVIAHLGHPDTAAFLDLAEQGAVWMDPSMALTDRPFLGQLPPAVVERVAGVADRLLFGTDHPSIPNAVVSQVRGLAALELTTQQLCDVLHGTADRLLGEAGRAG